MDLFRNTHRLAGAICLVWLCGAGHLKSHAAGAAEGAPTLGTVTDNGGATARLTWTNSAEAPQRFLGFAFDIYANNWVLGGEGGTLWHPFPAAAGSGDMPLGASGAYHVWISNQYASGAWYPCGNPWTGIVQSGAPHAPSAIVSQLLGRTPNLRLWWRPDIYGTWCYQIVVYKEGEGWVETTGPSGLSLWHVVDYGGAGYAAGQADFLEGWADFSLPAGAYWFYIRGVGWQPPFPEGQYAAARMAVPEEITMNLPGDVPLQMVRIPPGSFQMGRYSHERGSYDDEDPHHTVTIGYSFYLGKFEMTQRQWDAVMDSHSAVAQGDDDRYPVHGISWDDCQDLISDLNDLDLGGTFRLPSEAEWEYACRAGTQTRFFFGDSLTDSQGDPINDIGDDGPTGTPGNLPGDRSDYMWWWFDEHDNINPQYDYGAHPVGTKLPNQWGLYDMSGNLSEWCQDWYHSSYSHAPADGSAWESPSGDDRVCRGGGWYYPANLCRSANRGHDNPDYGIGLRLAWTPD